MKIAIKTPGVNWVLDEIAKDFAQFTRHEIVKDFSKADLIWCLDVFSIASLAQYKCPKVVSIHHINKEQISEYNFQEINKANFCIVPNDITRQDVLEHIQIPVYKLPYWLLSKCTEPKSLVSMKSNICPNGEILIGSFVKDGNGSDGITPKLSKSPTMFLEVLDALKSLKIKVLLAGYARGYVRNGLEQRNIPYVYCQNYNNMNMLYDCLDWYLVTSKYEGGPQSVLEASYRKVKILSTNVGMAPEVLHKDCICNNVNDFVDKFKNSLDRIEFNYEAVKSKYLHNIVIPAYDDLFDRKHE